MKSEGIGFHYHRLIRLFDVLEVKTTGVSETQSKETLSVEVVRQLDLVLSLVQVFVVGNILEWCLIPQWCLVAQ